MMKKNKKTEKVEQQNKSEDVKNAEETVNETETMPKECIENCSDIAKLKDEYKELEGKFQRLSADYANYQKRVPRQIEESITYKVESFIKSLLPGIDNFDHALSHASSSSLEDMIKGLEMVYENLLSILKSNGLEQIDAEGENFDPNCHQAVMQRADEEKDNGIVLEQYQKGYKFKDRVLRPAMVVVNKLPETEAPEQESAKIENEDQQQENDTKME